MVPEGLVSILLVDDDSEDRGIITDLIREEDSRYEVDSITTADKAIIHLSSLPADKLPKLIIIDFYMPMVTGLDLLRSLKSSEGLRHIPLIIYTNAFFPQYKGECMLAGASLYLQKSASVKECKKDVKKMLSYCLHD